MEVTLDDWLTEIFKAGDGDKEMEVNQRAVPAMERIISSDECQLDKRSTTVK